MRSIGCAKQALTRVLIPLKERRSDWAKGNILAVRWLLFSDLAPVGLPSSLRLLLYRSGLSVRRCLGARLE